MKMVDEARRADSYENVPAVHAYAALAPGVRNPRGRRCPRGRQQPRRRMTAAMTMTRPDLVVHHGIDAAIVSGDRALAAIDAAGIIRTARFSGWELPLADVPRLVDVARVRGWTCVEVELATRPT